MASETLKPERTFTNLRAANVARQSEWTKGQEVSSLFRATELAGEVGEACNVVKKLERERSGWAGSRATTADLAAELADVVICTDLLAIAEGIDLDAAVIAKFNATSEKVGMSTRLSAARAEGRAERPPAPMGEEGRDKSLNLVGFRVETRAPSREPRDVTATPSEEVR